MFVATRRTSSLEKEVNEAAEKGYEVVGMASPGAHVAILEKTGETHRELTTFPDPTQRYLLLATSKPSTIQKELKEATAAGFRVLLEFSTFMSGSMGGEVALLLEKTAVPTSVPEFLLLADGRLSKLQEELNQAASIGFRLLPRTLIMKPHYFSSRP